jgi:hypothetical protein
MACIVAAWILRTHTRVYSEAHNLFNMCAVLSTSCALCRMPTGAFTYLAASEWLSLMCSLMTFSAPIRICTSPCCVGRETPLAGSASPAQARLPLRPPVSFSDPRRLKQVLSKSVEALIRRPPTRGSMETCSLATRVTAVWLDADSAAPTQSERLHRRLASRACPVQLPLRRVQLPLRSLCLVPGLPRQGIMEFSVGGEVPSASGYDGAISPRGALSLAESIGGTEFWAKL